MPLESTNLSLSTADFRVHPHLLKIQSGKYIHNPHGSPGARPALYTTTIIFLIYADSAANFWPCPMLPLF